MSDLVSPLPRISPSRHVLALAMLLAVSFAFYASTLNNPFWHAEDFRFLGTVQELAETPSKVFNLDLTERHHPVPLAIFLLEYKVFGLNPAGYYAVNLFLHGVNAFLVYWLVTALLPDRRIAGLAGILFAMGVGSYGKAVMFVAGIENLLIASLYLLILNLYVRNDLWHKGSIASVRYALVVVLFLMVSFAKPTTFSLIAGLLAYKVFFRGERGPNRRVFELNFTILLVAALVFWIIRQLSGVVDFSTAMAGRNPFEFAVNFVGNAMYYLVHMFFPIHLSTMVKMNPVVAKVYEAAPVIRFLIGWALISYTFFGFVFGNRTIRFFLSWTVISVLPYCAFVFPDDWLNIRYLYQVSVGFTFILAAGTALSMDLLHRQPRRRFLPLIVPILFAVLSGYITHSLDSKYETAGGSAENQLLLEELTARADRQI